MAAYGVVVDETEAARQVAYLDAIYAENERVNLTRIPYGEEALILHVVDSLLVFALDGLIDKDSKIIDIGSGGGFPGVPVAVHSSTRVTLLDSVGKKMDAVGRALTAAGITAEVEAISGRAEEIAKARRGSYDVALARAVAPLEVIIEYAAPLLRNEGKLVAYKSELDSEELENGLLVADALGFDIVSRETFSLPQELGNRELLVFQSVRESSVKLPRRNGLARKKPLSTILMR